MTEVKAMSTDCASQVEGLTACLNDAKKVYYAAMDVVTMVKSKKVNFA
jgi:hypothetical protein